MSGALIESWSSIAVAVGKKERLTIRSFKTRDEMHRFLNKGDNSLRWRESTKELKPGTYAYAGGRWHNVKHLDAFALAHL